MNDSNLKVSNWSGSINCLNSRVDMNRSYLDDSIYIFRNFISLVELVETTVDQRDTGDSRDDAVVAQSVQCFDCHGNIGVWVCGVEQVFDVDGSRALVLVRCGRGIHNEKFDGLVVSDLKLKIRKICRIKFG